MPFTDTAELLIQTTLQRNAVRNVDSLTSAVERLNTAVARTGGASDAVALVNSLTTLAPQSAGLARNLQKVGKAITDIGVAAGASGEISTVATSIDRLSKAARADTGTNLLSIAKGITAVATASGRIGQSAEQVQASIGRIATAAKETSTRLGDVTTRLVNQETQLKQVTQRLGTYEQRLKAVEGQTRRVAAGQNAVNQRWNQGVDGLVSLIQAQARYLTGGAILFALLGRIRAGFQRVTESADQTARVLTALVGETDNITAAGNRLRRQLVETSTAVGRSVNDIADAQFELASAGFGLERTLAALPAVTDLAVGANSDLTQSTRLVIGLFNVFGDTLGDNLTETEKFRKISDILAKTFQDSTVSIDELANGIKFSGQAARTAGIPLEFLTAALGTLNDNLLRSGIGGRQLARTLVQLTGEADTLKREFGFTFETGNLEGLLQLLDGLRDRLNATGEVSQRTQQVLEDVFQSEGARAAATLAQNVDTLRTNFESLVGSAEGSAAAIRAVRLDNLAGRAAQASQAITNLIAGALQPLALVFDTILRILNPTLQLFIRLDNASKGLLSGLVGLTVTVKLLSVAIDALAISRLPQQFAVLGAALGGSSTAIAANITGITALNSVTGALGGVISFLATNPIGLLIVALGAAATAYAFFSGAQQKAVEDTREEVASAERAVKATQDRIVAVERARAALSGTLQDPSAIDDATQAILDQARAEGVRGEALEDTLRRLEQVARAEADLAQTRRQASLVERFEKENAAARDALEIIELSNAARVRDTAILDEQIRRREELIQKGRSIRGIDVDIARTQQFLDVTAKSANNSFETLLNTLESSPQALLGFNAVLTSLGLTLADVFSAEQIAQINAIGVSNELISSTAADASVNTERLNVLFEAQTEIANQLTASRQALVQATQAQAEAELEVANIQRFNARGTRTGESDSARVATEIQQRRQLIEIQLQGIQRREQLAEQTHREELARLGARIAAEVATSANVTEAGRKAQAELDTLDERAKAEALSRESSFQQERLQLRQQALSRAAQAEQQANQQILQARQAVLQAELNAEQLVQNAQLNRLSVTEQFEAIQTRIAEQLERVGAADLDDALGLDRANAALENARNLLGQLPGEVEGAIGQTIISAEESAAVQERLALQIADTQRELANDQLRNAERNAAATSSAVSEQLAGVQSAKTELERINAELAKTQQQIGDQVVTAIQQNVRAADEFVGALDRVDTAIDSAFGPAGIQKLDTFKSKLEELVALLERTQIGGFVPGNFQQGNFRGGGYTGDGPTGDLLNALLSRKEYVIPEGPTTKYGPDIMDAFRQGLIPKWALDPWAGDRDDERGGRTIINLNFSEGMAAGLTDMERQKFKVFLKEAEGDIKREAWAREGRRAE